MKELVWLFPVIFIFHDMEEIVGYIPWMERNKSLIKGKYPKIYKQYDNVLTEGFAAAVFEELILCIVISIVSVCTNWYGLWFGGFIGCTLHFAVHII